MNAPKRSEVPSKAALLHRYDAVFTWKVRAAVLAQDPDQVFRNWQGTMVGEGGTNIWARSDDDAQRDFRIITVNGR